MADTSPGKVQALRAMFSEKNQPVMGMPPAANKIPARRSSDSNFDAPTFKERILKEQKSASRLITKVLPVSKTELRVPLKPAVGPKPLHLGQQAVRPASPQGGNKEHCDTTRCESWTFNNGSQQSSQSELTKTVAKTAKRDDWTSSNGLQGSQSELSKIVSDTTKQDSQSFSNGLQKKAQSKTRTGVAETIATFMFSTGFGHKEQSLKRSDSKEVMLKLNSELMCSNLISSDNYICKSSTKFRRRVLPSLEDLGPAPAKPEKPPDIVFPKTYHSVQSSNISSVNHTSESLQSTIPILPHRVAPQRPSYPCPSRPHTSPPPCPTPATSSLQSLRQELEELYEDTILQTERKRPVSLIPEFTAEEEAEEELYNDADGMGDGPTLTLTPLPRKPREPPPPCPPSEYLQPRMHISTEDLYQDADDPDDEEFYEIMPCEAESEEHGSPLYSNNKKEIERLKRDEDKQSRKELKEKEKREKELDKLKKKFSLTGEEIPIDDGLVKADSRGGKGGDLPVKKGETVLILRMEGNPSGRWLVKNEKGKIGYVELTNIEVDPLSVKSVMTIRRISVISASEELYCEAKSEEEAIYEETY